MFEHNNVQITVAKNGEFSAVIKGVVTKKASLAAIKKAIDSATAFVPFKALVGDFQCRDPKEVEIVGIQKARGKKSYHNPDLWLDSAGRTHRWATRDTPENRALIKASKDIEAEHARAKKAVADRYEALCEKAREAIPYESVGGEI